MIFVFLFIFSESVKLRSAGKSEIKKAYGVETVKSEEESLVEQYDMKMLFFQNVKNAKDVARKNDNNPLKKQKFISPKQQKRDKEKMEFLKRKITITKSGAERPKIESMKLKISKQKIPKIEIATPKPIVITNK
ncbi:hypothetical protein TVAG_114280 [Trichomonas vaginalis G3]|uniref:Uncharacterized protein n=1 Tax=Trichomonas vaginalis (strain ATCC PRA-98 / G3) TaxID=412133 RepID=A2F3V5_TRIV3|nr:hypothetical protein TVAGG3_0281300 [Trichomonas vaginalis G3]EAY00424.1 hypothetical protein TVAG_114280 [Trichomonas vaginalis G3]KAI5526565.1 hypothetical protein TVAGG3_0281300 [Trichomonas vaginalis G3]|eukprot:XP_001313353.1 hypothetical protein [Trichomonas vaginalis G3]